jgi:tetratricopeptide (TPR) repeat protein
VNEYEEQKALKSAAEATAIIDFFKEVTLEARRSIKDGDKWRAKTVDEAAAIIDSEKVRELFADHPLAEAEIREWLAVNSMPTGSGIWVSLFHGLKKGQYRYIDVTPGDVPTHITILYDPDKSRRHLERALELRAIHLGPNDPKTLATMHMLGKTIIQVDEPKAFQVLGDLVGRSNATLGPDDDNTLEYKDSLAEAYEQAKKPGDAIILRKNTYMLTKNKLGADSNDTLNRSDRLAAAYEKAGLIEEGLRQREESLRGRRKLAAGSIDLSVGYALQEVARLYDQMHDHARAEPLWGEALLNVKENENVMDDVRASLGRCLLHTGKPADAEPVLRECLAIREKKDPDDWKAFHTKSLLGVALLGQKKYADAEPLLVAGYEGMKRREDKMPQEDKARLIESLERLVQLYDAWGRKDNADEWRKKWEAAKPGAKPRAGP